MCNIRHKIEHYTQKFNLYCQKNLQILTFVFFISDVHCSPLCHSDTFVASNYVERMKDGRELDSLYQKYKYVYLFYNYKYKYVYLFCIYFCLYIHCLIIIVSLCSNLIFTVQLTSLFSTVMTWISWTSLQFCFLLPLRLKLFHTQAKTSNKNIYRKIYFSSIPGLYLVSPTRRSSFIVLAVISQSGELRLKPISVSFNLRHRRSIDAHFQR